MARNAIPDFGVEYPEYEYKPWPKYAGSDAEGEALIANDAEELRRLKEIAVYPKSLGRDKAGNELIAQNPRDEKWLNARVHIERAIAEAEPVNSLDEPRRGPGRPPKVAA